MTKSETKKLIETAVNENGDGGTEWEQGGPETIEFHDPDDICSSGTATVYTEGYVRLELVVPATRAAEVISYIISDARLLRTPDPSQTLSDAPGEAIASGPQQETQNPSAWEQACAAEPWPCKQEIIDTADKEIINASNQEIAKAASISISADALSEANGELARLIAEQASDRDEYLEIGDALAETYGDE